MKRALVIVVLVLSLMAGPTAAQESGSFWDDVVSNEDGETSLSSTVSAILSWADGFTSRVGMALTDRGEWDPDDKADELQTFYNEHSTEFEQYANERSDADESADVIRITLIGEDESETIYLTADVNGTDYENTSIVEEAENHDEWISLCGYAAKNAPDELEAFHDEFVEPNDDVTAQYLARMNGQYGSQVKSSILNHTSRCEA